MTPSALSTPPWRKAATLLGINMLLWTLATLVISLIGLGQDLRAGVGGDFAVIFTYIGLRSLALMAFSLAVSAFFWRWPGALANVRRVLTLYGAILIVMVPVQMMFEMSGFLELTAVTAVYFGIVAFKLWRRGQEGQTALREFFTPAPSHLAIRSVGRIERVAIEDILWVGAAGNYVELHCREKTHLHRQSLAKFAEWLGPTRFLRIHRGYLVRADQIVRFENSRVILHSGEELPVSESYAASLRDALFRPFR